MFYISSRGSSACEWLAKSLSMHPNICCFNSDRSLPQLHGKEEDSLAPSEYISFLSQCESSSYKQKIFGGIHRFHGTECKESCDNEGGNFLYIVRDPFARIHSAWIYYLDQYFSDIPNDMVCRHICKLISENQLQKVASDYSSSLTSRTTEAKRQFQENYPTLSKLVGRPVKYLINRRKGFSGNKAGSDTQDLKYSINLFNDLALSFFKIEKALMDYCETSQGIKMEEMVASREYFNNQIISQIDYHGLGRYEQNAYLEKVFRQERFNVHRKDPLEPQQAWEELPDCLKSIFCHWFDVYKMKNFCIAWDYKILFN